MTSLFVAIALCLLPMGATVTPTDSGTCALDTRGIVQVCTDRASDYLTINIGDHYIDARSEELSELVGNI